MKVRPARQRGDAGVARSNAGPFGGESLIGGAGPNDDPMSIVALFFGEPETSHKTSARFQFDCFPARSIIDRLLEILAISHPQHFPGGGCVGECALHKYARQFGRTIKVTLASGCRRTGANCASRYDKRESEQPCFTLSDYPHIFPQRRNLLK